jgi:hypothetical protein
VRKGEIIEERNQKESKTEKRNGSEYWKKKEMQELIRKKKQKNEVERGGGITTERNIKITVREAELQDLK